MSKNRPKLNEGSSATAMKPIGGTALSFTATT